MENKRKNHKTAKWKIIVTHLVIMISYTVIPFLIIPEYIGIILWGFLIHIIVLILLTIDAFALESNK